MMGPFELFFTLAFAVFLHEGTNAAASFLFPLLGLAESLSDVNQYWARHCLSFLVVVYYCLLPKKATKVTKAAPVLTPDVLVDYEDPATKDAPVWTCSPEACMTIRYAKRGPASKEYNPAVTVRDIVRRAAANFPDTVALAIERPVPAKLAEKLAPSLKMEEWTKWTFSDIEKESASAALAFMEKGVPMFGSVALWGFNAPEWNLTFFACASIGAKIAGIYPTDSVDHVCYKIKQSGASVAVVEGKKQAETLLNTPKNLLGQSLKLIVVYSPDEVDASKALLQGGANKASNMEIIGWKELVRIGETNRTKVSVESRNPQPGHCCCLIYTSGTTGMPKAVMLSHDNVVSTATTGLYEIEKVSQMLRGAQRVLSYLPMSHVAGLMMDIVIPITVAARYNLAATVYYARKYDLAEATIIQRMEFVRPTFFLGVPRVWEKLAEGMKAVGAKVKPPISWLSAWAKAKCLSHAKNLNLGGSGKFPLKYAIANAFTGKVRKKIGLDQLQFGFTGAAPMNPETFEYWGSLGIRVFELFAMSESSGLATISSTRAGLWGSVGFAIPGSEVGIYDTLSVAGGAKRKLGAAANMHQPTEAEQGEICFRGRNVMMGYLANPSFGPTHVAEMQKKTAEAIDGEGFVRSGDKACVSSTGMFRITGRYKELIITAGGENIAPVPIETYVQANFPAISNIMMIGDKRKYNTCLLTLKCVGATGLEAGTEQLTPECLKALQAHPAGKGSTATTVSEAKTCPKVQAYCEAALKAVNGEASVCPSNACKIQKFAILPIDFSVVGEELTPTMKLKRSFVADKYKAEIESMYK